MVYTPNLTTSGWSTIPTITTGRGVYVDATSGSDSNDGLSEGAPKQTLAAAEALMREGYDDHMLLKRGEVWNEGINLGWSGIDAQHPSVITSYGSSSDAPPQINTMYNSLAVGPCSYLWIVDIQINDNFTIVSLGTDIRLEGVIFPPGENDAIVINSIDGQFTNIDLHRCVIYGRYPLSSTGHVQGIYLDEVHGCTISECVFDENGWSASGTRDGDGLAGPATIFNHNIYVQTNCSDIEIKKIWSSRASSHGIQLRPGGLIEDCIWYKNPINLLLGTELGAETNVRRNVIIDTEDINSSTPRGWAVELKYGDNHTNFKYNVAAHRTGGSDAKLLLVADAGGTSGTGIISNNKFYNWNSSVDIGSGVSGYNLLNNHIQNVTDDIVQSYPDGLSSSENNLYYTTDADGTRFQYNGSNVTDASWKSSVGDSGSTLSSLSSIYSDPDKDLSSYASSIGMSGGTEELLSSVKLQRKGNWDLNLTPDYINSYFRNNFDMLPAPQDLTGTVASHEVSLSWNGAPEDDSYVIERSADTSSWSVATSVSATSATDTPGTGDWYYRVTPVVNSVSGDASDSFLASGVSSSNITFSADITLPSLSINAAMFNWVNYIPPTPPASSGGAGRGNLGKSKTTLKFTL